jgi:hypothetical protein
MNDRHSKEIRTIFIGWEERLFCLPFSFLSSLPPEVKVKASLKIQNLNNFKSKKSNAGFGKKIHLHFTTMVLMMRNPNYYILCTKREGTTLYLYL